MAAVDYFLKIEGIEGESTDSKHAGAIELDSFSWGASQTGSFSAGAGGGSGKVQFQDFHFTSKVSKASPKLFLGCASGQHFLKFELFCRKAGEQQLDFMYIKMNDVLISGYSQGGSGGEVPSESVSLNFTKIYFSFTPQSLDGKLLPAVSAGWDLKQNKAL